MTQIKPIPSPDAASEAAIPASCTVCAHCSDIDLAELGEVKFFRSFEAGQVMA